MLKVFKPFTCMWKIIIAIILKKRFYYKYYLLRNAKARSYTSVLLSKQILFMYEHIPASFDIVYLF